VGDKDSCEDEEESMGSDSGHEYDADEDKHDADELSK
jgi:hypothetical protein